MTDDLGNTINKRGYFPNVGRNPGAGNQQFPQAPGVAEGQARIAQLQGRRGQGGLIMVDSPNGGSMGVTASQLPRYLSKGYTQQVPPMSTYDQKMTQSLVAQNRAYGESPASNSQGQLSNMQNGQSLGGNYIAQNGVFDPNVPKKPGFFSAFPAIAQLLMPRGMSAAIAYGQNVSTGQGAGNQYANPSRNATPGATPQTGQDSQYFSYNPSPLSPRRLDFKYF